MTPRTVAAVALALLALGAAPPMAAADPSPPAAGDAPGRDRPLADAVARMTPPVVNVSTRRRGGEASLGRDSESDGRGGRLFDRLFPGGDRAPRRSLGSGVIVDATGYVLTNAHVIGGADEIRVTLADEREFRARVVGRDARTDVALLKIDAVGLPVATLGDSDSLRVGDRVVAVGNPYGLSQTVTAGIVSAKGRVIGAGPYDDFIQTDASINPGNSGGPLFDLDGRVVGINTAIVESARGIGFAIPVNLIKAELDQLRVRGRVVRGFLGVSVQHISPPLARAFTLPRTGGALVSAVEPRGAAERAGVLPGDVVLSVDGRPVPTSDRLAEMVAGHEPGSAVRLGLLRRGRFVQVGAVVQALPEGPQDAEDRAATAGEARDGEGARRDPERQAVAGRDAEVQQERGGPLGVTVREQTRAEAQAATESSARGVVVDEVRPAGPSAGRLEVGDVVLEVDHVAARTATDFASLVRRALARGVDEQRPLLVRVRRDDTPLYVAIDRAAPPRPRPRP